jgi:hypothetical protein
MLQSPFVNPSDVLFDADRFTWRCASNCIFFVVVTRQRRINTTKPRLPPAACEQPKRPIPDEAIPNPSRAKNAISSIPTTRIARNALSKIIISSSQRVLDNLTLQILVSAEQCLNGRRSPLASFPIVATRSAEFKGNKMV